MIMDLRKLLNDLEYLMTHNKNLTKKQYYIICEAFEEVYQELIRREMMKK